ncbi:MAG: DUF1284 domain-containing protein [Clostridiales bacterium]|nr:DUF1284 domain-containing protein [Clostridiales bacterium]
MSLKETVQKTNPILLRAHHGMCLAYFEGKGYSKGFSAHMQKMLEQLTGMDSIATNDSAIDGIAADSIEDADGVMDKNRCKKIQIRLVTHTDEICSACPNNLNGSCRDSEKVRKFDCGVLDSCGLTEEQILEFDEFASLVQAHILSAGRRAEICGGCQWESICANRKSRWES